MTFSSGPVPPISGTFSLLRPLLRLHARMHARATPRLQVTGYYRCRQMIRAFVGDGSPGAGLSLTGALAAVQRRKAAGMRVSPVDAEKCRRVRSPAALLHARCPCFLLATHNTQSRWTEGSARAPRRQLVVAVQVRPEKHSEGLGRGGCRGARAVLRPRPDGAAAPLPGMLIHFLTLLLRSRVPCTGLLGA